MILAHLNFNSNIIEHSLEEHLLEVSKMSSSYCSYLKNDNLKEIIRIAGLWHDLGKFNPEWQEYLKMKSGYYSNTFTFNCGKVNHSSAGAILANQSNKINDINRKIIAYCIAGHHAGLADSSNLNNRLAETHHLDDAMNNIPQNILNINDVGKIRFKKEHLHHYIRYIFSCLVDADFLDTEMFMNFDKFNLRKRSNNMLDLEKKLDYFLEKITNSSNKTKVNKLRKIILDDCNNASKLEPGFFRLTVPTGGGKTLSSLSFALKHCNTHSKSRVIYAIPYTSIIEQTSDVYKSILGADAVVEHHSNLVNESLTFKNKLSSENWDAPIIVTTFVQLFESLFSNKPSKCRKIHNIANSVIVIDEAQMIPFNNLNPIIEVMKFLVEELKCTIVLCTATQPNILGNIGSGLNSFNGIAEAKEIMTTLNPNELADKFKRVNLKFIDKELQVSDLSQLIDNEDNSLLCIVDNRDLCKEIFDNIKFENKTLLSNNMCGEHKSKIITDIKSKLTNNEIIKVISTQLVETGVDFDFPVVYKKLSGLDSMAQAAGRCNREGKLEVGNVYFFKMKSKSDFIFKDNVRATNETIRKFGNFDKFSPNLFDFYFEKYSNIIDNFDVSCVKDNLVDGYKKVNLNFKTASENFNLINDVGETIIVRFNNENEIEELINNGLSNHIMRKLQRYSVNISTATFNELKQSNLIECIHNIYVQKKCCNIYTPTYGVKI